MTTIRIIGSGKHGRVEVLPRRCSGVSQPAAANSYRKTIEPASAVISFTSTGVPSAV
jgi:hypothetical protein